MKAALAAQRSVDVLNHLTEHPRTAFTLSEISAALGVSPTSMSAVLLALTEAGYLIRHPRHKTYELGPALVAAGHSASIRHPIVELARDDMIELALLGTECVGAAVVGGDILVLALEGTPSPYGNELRSGQRLPLVAPYGQVFLTWTSGGPLRRWLGPLADDEEGRTEYERSFEIVRARGFSVGLRTPSVTSVRDAISLAGQRPRDKGAQAMMRESIPGQGHAYVLDEIDDGASYLIANISAPIFGADSSVVYALTIQGMDALTGAEVRRVGEQLVDTCRGITRRLGGRAPDALHGLR